MRLVQESGLNKRECFKEERYIKIRIIGACGSGKSYIAKELSKKYRISHYETDNLVWDRSEPYLRYPTEISDSKLNDIILTESWIIEGVHHKWGHASFRKADLIYIIVTNKFQRDYRVLRRFIRTRLGMEQCNYKQSYKNTEIIELTEEFSDKRILVRNNKQILKHVERYLEITQGGNNFT